MKKIFYNKVIRDRIPSRIKAAGADYDVRVLPKKKFEQELIKKVEEEASGMQRATSRTELVSEIADVIDVIEEIKSIKKITTREVAAAQRVNMMRKGGFKKRLWLRWSSDDGYKTNEKRYDRRRGAFPRTKK
ncbi:MAG: phosphoribosyl-ATP pyrophosphohydrolase [Patescibacteria group bacterium]